MVKLKLVKIEIMSLQKEREKMQVKFGIPIFVTPQKKEVFYNNSPTNLKTFCIYVYGKYIGNKDNQKRICLRRNTHIYSI